MSSHSCVIPGGSWTAPHPQERRVWCCVLCWLKNNSQCIWCLSGSRLCASKARCARSTDCFCQLRSGITAQWIQGLRGSGEDPSLPQLPQCSHGFEPWPQTAQCSGLVFAHALQEAMRRPGSFPGQKVPGSALGLDTVELTALA